MASDAPTTLSVVIPVHNEFDYVAGALEELFDEIAETYGGKWAFEPDPIKAANKMIAHIDKKRSELGIDRARERILVDMAARRELESA